MFTLRTAAASIAAATLALGVAVSVAIPADAGSAPSSATTPFSAVERASASVQRAADGARLFGMVFAVTGETLDNVVVTATAVGENTPAASSITYGGAYTLEVPWGTFRIKFHDPEHRVADVTLKDLVPIGPREPEEIGLQDQYMPLGPARNLVRPQVRGVPRVGSTLRADVGTWEHGTDLRYSFRWLVAGKVAGTRAQLTLKPAQLGKKVALRVTGSSRAWTPTAANATRVVSVKKSRPRLKVAAPTAPVSRAAGRALLRVTPTGTTTPHAKIRVSRNGRVVATGTANGGRTSAVAVPMRFLAVGRNVLKVTWTGRSYERPATASAVLYTRR